MKAAVYRRYGPPEVVRVEDLPKPAPSAGEVLIKVRASTVTAADWRLRRASPYLVRIFNGLLRPKKVNVLGWELAGTVEGIGKDVSGFKEGDEVFAFTGFKFGACAEYCCVSARGEKLRDGVVLRKPPNLSFEQAAAIPVGSVSAYAFLEKAGLQSGHEILIHGASGSVGTFAVQFAKIRGARITAVCSGANVELVRSLGAERVVDYTRESIASSDRRFDIVFDAAGKFPNSQGKRLLRADGKFVTVRAMPGEQKRDVLLHISELASSGQLRPVIDRSYPLEKIAQAHAYVETEHKKGNVVVLI